MIDFDSLPLEEQQRHLAWFRKNYQVQSSYKPSVSVQGTSRSLEVKNSEDDIIHTKPLKDTSRKQYVSNKQRTNSLHPGYKPSLYGQRASPSLEVESSSEDDDIYGKPLNDTIRKQHFNQKGAQSNPVVIRDDESTGGSIESSSDSEQEVFPSLLD